MKITKKLLVSNRKQWRAWLKANHARVNEIWLIYYKRGSGRPRIPYDDAVEEALCYGWIDSTIQRIDGQRYAQRFTPRKRGSRWSLLNRKRVAKLIKHGRMTKAGLAAVDSSPNEERKQAAAEVSRQRKLTPPGFMREALKANGKAWLNFTSMAPSYRRLYVGWVTEAKREETKARRLKRAVRSLAMNRKPGML